MPDWRIPHEPGDYVMYYSPTSVCTVKIPDPAAFTVAHPGILVFGPIPLNDAAKPLET